MKIFGTIAGVGAALILAGCESPLQAELKANCLVVVTEPQIIRDVRDADITADAFCTCAARQFANFPEPQLAGAQSSMAMLARAMTEDGKSGEELYRDLKDAADAVDATPEVKAVSQAFDAFGEQLEGVFDEMKDAGGRCPV